MGENASALALLHDQIATLIGITGKTLRRKYRRELDLGMAKANLAVAQALYKRCLEGSDTVLIW